MNAIDGEVQTIQTEEISLQSRPADEWTPPFPQRLEDLDVSPAFLADLALKAVSVEAESTTVSVVQRLHLGILIVEQLLQRLVQEKLIEAKGLAGLHNHRYAMLDHGWAKVDRLMNQSTYVGPAPVSLRLTPRRSPSRSATENRSRSKRWRRRCQGWCFPTPSSES